MIALILEGRRIAFLGAIPGRRKVRTPLVDRFYEQLMVNRFTQKIIGSQFHRLHCRVNHADACQHDDGGFYLGCPDKIQNVTPRHVRQIHIKQG